jgi:hypothetical protein
MGSSDCDHYRSEWVDDVKGIPKRRYSQMVLFQYCAAERKGAYLNHRPACMLIHCKVSDDAAVSEDEIF